MNLTGSIATAISLSALCFANIAVADVAVCPLEEAMRRLEDYNRNLNAEIAQKQMPILKEMQEIGSKAKNPSLNAVSIPRNNATPDWTALPRHHACQSSYSRSPLSRTTRNRNISRTASPMT
jgi:hypothetical protein